MDWLLVVSILSTGATAFLLAGLVDRKPRATPLAPVPTSVPEHAEAERVSAVSQPEVAPPEPEPVPAAVAEAEPLSVRLGRTRSALFGGLGGWFFGRGALSGAQWDELEERLLAGDVGVKTTELLLERAKRRYQEEQGRAPLAKILFDEGCRLFEGPPHGSLDWAAAPKPLVISVVGINGAGKTTSVGKLAARFAAEGKKVLLGAADTFRAAAQEQLRVWAERSGADFVGGREGGDPGAVAFDATTAGKARGVDVVLLDTAGRLHNKAPLVEELKKVHRVVQKVIADAPHERWLVLDGTLGQNSLQQARVFQEALALTGLVVTKLDGTAKGGAVLAVVRELNLPVRFVGVGESVADLVPFEPRAFVEALLAP